MTMNSEYSIFRGKTTSMSCSQKRRKVSIQISKINSNICCKTTRGWKPRLAKLSKPFRLSFSKKSNRNKKSGFKSKGKRTKLGSTMKRNSNCSFKSIKTIPSSGVLIITSCSKLFYSSKNKSTPNC